MSASRGAWLQALGGLVVLVVLVAGCGSQPASTPAPSPVPSAPAPTSPWTSPTPSPTPSPTASASPTPSATATPSSAPTHRSSALRAGDRGSAVLALQKELSALGYWLGTPDGTFGDLTEQAVYALQKAAGLVRDGRVGPRTARALAAGIRPHAHSTVGHVVEVDLDRQLVLVVDDGHVQLVLNTSTGSGHYYWYEGRRYVAVTPRGRFAVYAQIDALRISPLGRLWRPKYFHGGIALHGSLFVPPWPDSHGCVRLSDPAIDMLWRTGLVPIGTPVWVV